MATWCWAFLFEDQCVVRFEVALCCQPTRASWTKSWIAWPTLLGPESLRRSSQNGVQRQAQNYFFLLNDRRLDQTVLCLGTTMFYNFPAISSLATELRGMASKNPSRLLRVLAFHQVTIHPHGQQHDMKQIRDVSTSMSIPS